MKRFVLAAAVPLIFGLTACGATVETTTDGNGLVSDTDKIYGKVRPITVDGVKCILFDADGGGGAISCNWNE